MKDYTVWSNGADVWVTPNTWTVSEAWKWLLNFVGYDEDDSPLENTRPATKEELAIRVVPDERFGTKPLDSDPQVGQLAQQASGAEFLCTTEW